MKNKVLPDLINRRTFIRKVLAAGSVLFLGFKRKTSSITPFEHITIKNMKLRNRFVRSATYDGYANISGHVTEEQIKLFSDLATGGVGLIITGMTNVHHSGQISPFQNSIASDDCIPGLKSLTDAVHNLGAKIAAELAHAGKEAAWFLGSKNKEAIAPSFVSDDTYFEGKYREMTEDEILEIVCAFGDGAIRAREAGFDAVQLHGAHAYLLSQFLSPFTNRRIDNWGGPLRNRLRIHQEIYRDIRSKVGEDYPVMIKLGVQDGFQGGLKLEEGILAAKVFAEWGFDVLEISQGLRGEWYEGTEFRSEINSIDKEGYFRSWCKGIKNQVKVPVSLVGGLRSFKLINEIIQNNEADLISLSRPLIREPDLINDWKVGDLHRAKCISCNLCLQAVMSLQKLHCVQRTIADDNDKQGVKSPFYFC